MTDRRIVKVRIHGVVQRVGYRVWTERQSAAAGVEGWVRNRSDGSVEAVFAASEEVIGRMIESCRAGPAKARVTKVIVIDADETELALRATDAVFDVLPTE